MVDHGEFARQIGLDRQITKARLDASIHADDVGNRGSRRNRHAVGIAHTVLRNLFAQRIPIQSRRAINFYIATALFGEQVKGVQRQDAAIPQRIFVSSVLAALSCQLSRCPVSVVANRFHRLIGELHGCMAAIRRAQFIQAILERHET